MVCCIGSTCCSLQSYIVQLIQVAVLGHEGSYKYYNVCVLQDCLCRDC